MNPRKYFDSNVKSFEILLDTLKPLGVENFILSSSSAAAVYGTPDTSIEEGAVSPYGETKLRCEEILDKFAK